MIVFGKAFSLYHAIKLSLFLLTFFFLFPPTGRNRYYAAQIVRVRSNGTYDLDYDDGEKELGIDKSLIRLSTKTGPQSLKTTSLVDKLSFSVVPR